jgi:hypothetical protein
VRPVVCPGSSYPAVCQAQSSSASPRCLRGVVGCTSAPTAVLLHTKVARPRALSVRTCSWRRRQSGRLGAAQWPLREPRRAPASRGTSRGRGAGLRGSRGMHGRRDLPPRRRDPGPPRRGRNAARHHRDHRRTSTWGDRSPTTASPKSKTCSPQTLDHWSEPAPATSTGRPHRSAGQESKPRSHTGSRVERSVANGRPRCTSRTRSMPR